MNKSELLEAGYVHIKKLPDGTFAGLAPFIFTTAIVYGFDSVGYTHRFCYSTPLKAQHALESWEGVGEPEGWHKALVQGQPVRIMGKEGQVLTENEHGRMIDSRGRVIIEY